jgi:uncharacterized protein YbaP (TraB family)
MAGLDPAIHPSICRGLNFSTLSSPAAAAQQLKFQNCKHSRFPLKRRDDCIEGLRRRSWGAVIFRVILMAVVLFVFTPARADDPPITDWSQVETVVVQAKAEGPAFWHVTKGNSEVWILGTINPAYMGMPWEEGRLVELIRGSKEVVLQPEPDIGFISAVWFALTYSGKMKMPEGQKLDDVLPSDLRQRYTAIVESMGGQTSKYERYTPFIAGTKLLADYDKANKLLTKWLEPAVEVFSREAGVRTKPAGEIDAIPAIKDILNKPPADGVACFAATVKAIEDRRKHAVAAANAWAKGDVASIKAHYSDTAASRDACIAGSTRLANAGQQMIETSVAAIHNALATPGKTVVLVSIGTLLRRGGVLDRLHEEGLTVEGPAE